MPIIFFVFWIILNGNITLEIALFGVAISFAVYFFCYKFLGYRIRKEVRLYCMTLRYIGYAGLLVWEIAKANIDVLKVIYNFKRKPDSVLVQFTTDLASGAARTALANSITLTPGTITVFQEDESYTVHCLDKAFADGMEESCFVKYLRKTEAVIADSEHKSRSEVEQ